MLFVCVKITISFPLIPVTLSVSQARSIQLKAVVISERVLGFDHPNTIQQYVSITSLLYKRVCTCGCIVIIVP